MLRERSKQGEDLQTIIDGVTEETIGQYLYALDLPDPDLIIRTSGEIRLSGSSCGRRLQRVLLL